MKLSVRIVGPAPFKRYMIVRDHDGVVEFWDGKGWSRRNGLLYYAERHLAPDYERLELEQTEGQPERTFRTQAIVHIPSSERAPLQSVKEALYAAATLHLSIDDHGKGPVPASTTLIDIAWNDAKEVAQPAQHEGLPARVFETPVVVRVRSVQPFDLSNLKKYLAAATTFHLDMEHGNEPVPGDTHVEIRWSDLEEVAPRRAEGWA